MAKSDPGRALLPENQDDFQQIKGIGPSIAQALHEAEIHRYADLARYTPQQLVDLLRTKVAFITLQRITRDDWIGQARELAGRQEREQRESASQVSQAPPPGDSWKELADFFVSFGESIRLDGEAQVKTRVHYSQTDKSMEWDGIASDELMEWMLKESNLHALRNAWEQTAAPPPTPVAETGMEVDTRPVVSNLWVTHVDMAGSHPGQAWQRMVRVEADLDFPETAGSFRQGTLPPFAANVILVNLETNASTFFDVPIIPVETETPLAEEPHAAETHFKFRHDFPIPPRGRYQLYLVTRLAPPSTVYTLEEGPVIRVE